MRSDVGQGNVYLHSPFGILDVDRQLEAPHPGCDPIFERRHVIQVTARRSQRPRQRYQQLLQSLTISVRLIRLP